MASQPGEAHGLAGLRGCGASEGELRVSAARRRGRAFKAEAAAAPVSLGQHCCVSESRHRWCRHRASDVQHDVSHGKTMPDAVGMEAYLQGSGCLASRQIERRAGPCTSSPCHALMAARRRQRATCFHLQRRARLLYGRGCHSAGTACCRFGLRPRLAGSWASAGRPGPAAGQAGLGG